MSSTRFTSALSFSSSLSAAAFWLLFIFKIIYWIDWVRHIFRNCSMWCLWNSSSCRWPQISLLHFGYCRSAYPSSGSVLLHSALSNRLQEMKLHEKMKQELEMNPPGMCPVVNSLALQWQVIQFCTFSTPGIGWLSLDPGILYVPHERVV